LTSINGFITTSMKNSKLWAISQTIWYFICIVRYQLHILQCRYCGSE